MNARVLKLLGSGANQFFRPIADLSVGSWTTHTGATTNLFQQIDEVEPPNDADYVQSEDNPVASEVSFNLTAGSDPGVDLDTFLNIRMRRNPTSDYPLTATVTLKQGTTTIATRTYTSFPSDGVWRTEQPEFTAAEISAVTDWGDLRVHVSANMN